MTDCDQCGTKVSTRGYLGGGIICKDCAEKNRKEMEANE